MIDPGKLFLLVHNEVNSPEDILAYANFLRRESNQDAKLPVDLDCIFNRFQMPTPIYTPLNFQQGLLVDAATGIIMLNSNDIPTRQRFTQAHELIELLFNSLPNGKNLGNGWTLKKPGGFNEKTKEQLCNWAAANLLMPPDYVKSCIARYNVNFNCARVISDQCEVSFSAALIQIALVSPRKHSVVLWKIKNKPTELRKISHANQLSLFNTKQVLPEEKLRVEWSISNESAPIIPLHKSVEKTSLIYKAYQSGSETSGNEHLFLGDNYLQSCHTENLPFLGSDGMQVLSIIEHL